MRQLHTNPIAVSASGHTAKQIDSFDVAIRMQECPPHKRFLVGCRLTLLATRRTPHGASCLVLAMSDWSVKTRRAPSRHCRDARVYGHTTTAMHDMSTHTPLARFPRRAAVCTVPYCFTCDAMVLVTLPRVCCWCWRFASVFFSRCLVARERNQARNTTAYLATSAIIADGLARHFAAGPTFL